MRVLFLGESDTGLNPSSQNAAALASSGVDVEFDKGAGWRSSAWRETCDRIDVAHLVTYSQCNWMLLRRLWRARARGVQIVRYWVGSDCLWARFHAPTRRFAQALGHLGTINLAVSENLIEELAAVGVDARLVPVITPHISAAAQPHPLPAQLTVLCYLPTRRREFYGGSLIDALVEKMPEVRFIILGDRDTDYSRHRNVESLGTVEELSRTMGRCTVLLRPTAHDGMPRMVLEMLSHGRHAITSLPLPHCQHAADLGGIESALRRLRRRCEFNLAGREWVCENFETKRTARVLGEVMEQSISPGRPALRRAGKRQARKVLMRAPWLLSRKCYPLPRAEELPDEADALRLALAGPSAAPSELDGRRTERDATCAC
ncbi:MAG: glycosyltransferase family 4 protein [bacterium]|nr:glycosyltransferase family 4 protein [bacterium]